MSHRSFPARRRLAFAGLVALLAGGAAACGSDHQKVAAPTPTPSPAASPTASPPHPPATVPPPATAALTGTPGPAGPVSVVKVDNAASARPLQRGLAAAAVVYQELVEGGATRFAAVFAGPSSPEIGPVRSARDSDVELLAEYGPVLFGFSGANRNVLAHVDASTLIDVSQEHRGGAYTQKGRRVEAYNFYTDVARLISHAPRKGAQVKDVGFRFGPLPAGGRAVSGSVTARFNAYSFDTFRYDAAHHGWRLTQNGRPMDLADGTSVIPQNVLVQFVALSQGRYVDVLGNNSPDSRTIGSGKAVLFRDGRRYDGTWRRPRAGAGTRFLAAGGTDLLLRPGQTWVLLVPTGSPLGVS